MQEPNRPPWCLSGGFMMLTVGLELALVVLLLGVFAILEALKNAPIGHEDEYGFRVDPKKGT